MSGGRSCAELVEAPCGGRQDSFKISAMRNAGGSASGAATRAESVVAPGVRTPHSIWGRAGQQGFGLKKQFPLKPTATFVPQHEQALGVSGAFMQQESCDAPGAAERQRPTGMALMAMSAARQIDETRTLITVRISHHACIVHTACQKIVL